ncbi:MAG: hypothetical protein WED10_11025 [Brumimicrobium sp.]
MITKKEVLDLANIHDSFCVSIFIPTHRAGEETLSGKDALHLKNQLKDARSKLEGQGMSQKEINDFTKPVYNLLNDSEFWRHQSDGLAIFLTEKMFKKFTVPVRFEEFNYVSNEFYIKSLMPLFNGDGLFYLLTLKADEVKFYEGTRHSITEIETPEEVPSQLEDVVGYDYEQKSLQFRSEKQGNREAGMYHGHGEGDAKEQDELESYFRAIDKGIMSMLHDNQKPPLVVCCLDTHFAQYKEVNTYDNLFPKNISGNPADKDIQLLHEESWQLLEPYFSKLREDKKEEFHKLLGSGKASSDIGDIISASLNGKVDTLFIENRADVFGTFDPNKQDIKVEEVRKVSNVSLLNISALNTFKKDGNVFLMESENMPDNTSKVNAVYKY